jgi:TPP-dependent pyruvate/acetoin dehydrogenase alpha subunit
MAIYLGRGMGVQIGVHNIAPCFVSKGGTNQSEFLEGTTLTMVWIQLVRL